MDKQRLEENLFRTLMILSMLVILGSSVSVLVVVLWRGAPALSISMLTQTSTGGYEDLPPSSPIVGILVLKPDQIPRQPGETVSTNRLSIPSRRMLQRPDTLSQTEQI